MPRGTFESRPSEPGSSGRATGSVLRDMDLAMGGLGKVRSAQFVGFNTKGQKVYKVTYRSPMGTLHLTQAWNGKSFEKAGKLRGTKSLPSGLTGSGRRDPGLRAELRQKATIDAMKQQWHLTIQKNSNLSPHQRMDFTRFIDSWSGSARGLDLAIRDRFEEAALHAVRGELDDGDDGDEGEDPFGIEDWLNALGGGGFGGGFGGPQYVAPDRRVVEDNVKGALVSLVGEIPDDAMVSQFADLYMTDHRRNFDSVDKEIDPAQSVREAIRQTDQYQEIHENRPESEDERSWVSDRRAAAQQGGLTTGLQEEFAITQATAAGDVDDVREAASVAQLQQSGSAQGTLLEGKLRNVAESVFRGVR